MEILGVIFRVSISLAFFYVGYLQGLKKKEATEKQEYERLKKKYERIWD